MPKTIRVVKEKKGRDCESRIHISYPQRVRKDNVQYMSGRIDILIDLSNPIRSCPTDNYSVQEAEGMSMLSEVRKGEGTLDHLPEHDALVHRVRVVDSKDRGVADEIELLAARRYVPRAELGPRPVRHRPGHPIPLGVPIQAQTPRRNLRDGEDMHQADQGEVGRGIAAERLEMQVGVRGLGPAGEGARQVEVHGTPELVEVALDGLEQDLAGALVEGGQGVGEQVLGDAGDEGGAAADADQRFAGLFMIM